LFTLVLTLGICTTISSASSGLYPFWFVLCSVPHACDSVFIDWGVENSTDLIGLCEPCPPGSFSDLGKFMTLSVVIMISCIYDRLVDTELCLGIKQVNVTYNCTDLAGFCAVPPIGYQGLRCNIVE
jgi:hypothetical protein